MNVVDDLERVFPDHRSPQRAAAWAAVKARVPAGSCVSGVVVARYPFGAFLDVGVRFPALLQIVHIEGMSAARYRADDWCPLGSTVTAFVDLFNDQDRRLGLRQPGHRSARPK